MLFEYDVHIAPPPEGVVAKFQGEYERCKAAVLEDGCFIQDEEERVLEVDARLCEAQRQFTARLAKRSVVHGGLLSRAAYESLRIVFEFELSHKSTTLPQGIAEYVTWVRELEKSTGLTFKILAAHAHGAAGVVIATRTIAGHEEAHLLASWGEKKIDLPLVQKQARKIKEERIRNDSGFVMVLILACAIIFAILFATSGFSLAVKVLAPIVALISLVFVVDWLKRGALRRARMLE